MNILITLQPSNTVDFFNHLNSVLFIDHRIIIRPHPRLNTRSFLDSLSDLLDFPFEIDNASNIGDSLLNVDLHITEYSSCVLDATMASVPSPAFIPLPTNTLTILKIIIL